jgi:hypothetical protein
MDVTGKEETEEAGLVMTGEVREESRDPSPAIWGATA